jgi:hypothetical protein
MAEKIPNVRLPLAPKEIATLGLLTALMLGALLRLTPPALARFPLNDGGMFYTIINDLGKSNYALPAWTTYNGSTIPLVYPPLGFYIARILVDLLHISPLQVLLWLPPFFTLLAIPAFYLFARETFEAEIPAALAALIFAFSPRSFSWFVMGGGLTRALGLISLLLTLFAATRLFKTPSRKNLGMTILFGGMTVLSHPEAIIHTIGAAVWLWITISRKKSAFMDGLKVCAGVIICTSPWWGTILLQHGISPLLNASQTGFHNLSLALIPFSFTEEPFMTIIPVLGIVGAFGEFHHRRFFLPGWIILSFLIDPRSAAWVANIALAMLAALALDQIILPGLANLSEKPTHLLNNVRYQNRSAKLLIGYLLFYLLSGSYLYMLNMSTVFLSNAHQTAMAWIRNNTPPASRFILLTPGSDYPMRDPIQEWFPALTERISLTTMQGQEWTLGSNFAQTITENRNLQVCAHQIIGCLDVETAKLAKSFDFIYLNKNTNYQLGSSWANSPDSKSLEESLKDSEQYHLVYENEAVAVFNKQSK